MNNYYPDYYKKFKCIANLCPDSCCQGWDVVVDKESQLIFETEQELIKYKERISLEANAKQKTF